MEMKREYVRPTAVIETFAANEYCASCGDVTSGITYNFSCDASATHTKTEWGYEYKKWVEKTVTVNSADLYYYRNAPITPGSSYYTSGSATRLGSYHPCNTTTNHQANNYFYAGFVDLNENGIHDTNESVIVWRGPNNNNGHATTNLNIDTWEKVTAKS